MFFFAWVSVHSPFTARLILKARARMSPRPFLALQVSSWLSHLGVVGHVIVVDHLGVVNHLNLHHFGNLYHYDKEPKNTMRDKGLV